MRASMSRPPADPILNRGARLGAVALLYVAVVAVLAYPLSMQMTTHVTSPAPDTDLTLWALAWDVHAFTDQPLSIFDANIFYPQHLTLAYSENFIGSALLVAPALWITGNPVLAFNLIALGSAVLCGLGAYLLARRLGASPAGATLAGLVFAFSPARFLRLDQLHLAPIQWIPFCLASVIAYLDDGRPRHLRLAALFFTLQALTSGHGAVFMVVSLAVLILHRLARGTPIAITQRLRDLGVLGAMALVPTVLMFIPYLIVQREMGFRRPLVDWSISWSSFLASPSHVHVWLMSWFPHARINESAGAYLFPGILPIVLALAAAWPPRADSGRKWTTVGTRDAVFPALLTILGFWISAGSPIGVWPLVYWLPGFNLVRVPSRFILVAVLGLALLAGLGFDAIAARLKPSVRGAVAVVLGLLLVAEFAAMPFETKPYAVDPPAIDRWLATRSTPFAVAEVPLPSPDNVVAWEQREATLMLHTTAHWQKTVHGYSGFRPGLHVELFDALTRFPSAETIRALTDFSVTYVVVHTDWYPPEEWKRIEEEIGRTPALRLEHVEGAGRVYSLPR
jgi:hypothetical protein